MGYKYSEYAMAVDAEQIFAHVTKVEEIKETLEAKVTSRVKEELEKHGINKEKEKH